MYMLMEYLESGTLLQEQKDYVHQSYLNTSSSVSVSTSINAESSQESSYESYLMGSSRSRSSADNSNPNNSSLPSNQSSIVNN